MRGKIGVKGLRPLPTGFWGTGSSWHGCNPRDTVRVRRPREGEERGGWAAKQPGAPPDYGGPGSGHGEVTGPQRPGQGDPAAAPSLGSRSPRASGGGGVYSPSPRSRPARPSLPARCGARSPARSPTLTSPAAPAAPPLPGAPPPTPGRKSGAGSESRGVQRVGTRGASAPGTGSDRSPRLRAVLEPV